MLDGTSDYTLTFARGQLPPVNGFWSITMYEVDRGWWFVPNPLNRFTASGRGKLTCNAGGSLTRHLQPRSSGKDKEANWLPTPEGAFLPMLRMFEPRMTAPAIIDGSWHPPAIRKSTTG